MGFAAEPKCQEGGGEGVWELHTPLSPRSPLKTRSPGSWGWGLSMPAKGRVRQDNVKFKNEQQAASHLHVIHSRIADKCMELGWDAV